MTCENCLLKIKGECFGGGICDSFRGVPTMRNDDKEYWPRVMRSSGLYKRETKRQRNADHLRRVKQQQKDSHNKQLALDSSSLASELSKKSEQQAKQRRQVTSTNNPYHHSDKDYMAQMRKEYYDNILIWVDSSYRNGKHFYSASMEYKKHVIRTYPKTDEGELNSDSAKLSGILASVKRITKGIPIVCFVKSKTSLKSSKCVDKSIFDEIEKVVNGLGGQITYIYY